MAATGWPELVTMLFHFASTVAIVGAALKYYWSRDHRSGETLQRLEDTFRRLHEPWQCAPSGPLLPGITRAVDRAAGEFVSSGLSLAVRKGFDATLGPRDDVEKAWMPRLDELLRFLLIVAALERNGLLKKRALWDAYHYWFRTIVGNDLLRFYVGMHFPVLDRFLADNGRQIEKYDALQEARKNEARLPL